MEKDVKGTGKASSLPVFFFEREFLWGRKTSMQSGMSYIDACVNERDELRGEGAGLGEAEFVRRVVRRMSFGLIGPL